MKFGVEVEIGGLLPGEIADKLAVRHIKVVRENRIRDCGCQFCVHEEHQNPEGYDCRFVLRNFEEYTKEFVIKPDNSLDEGFELNTPIMKDFSELKYLDSLFKAIKKEKIHLDSDCGMHIHIGTKWKKRVASPKGVEILTTLWNETELPKAFKPNAYRLEEFSLDGVHNTKHSVINYQTVYETLEYRVFDTKLSIKYVQDALEFCLGFSKELNRRMKEAGLIAAKGSGIPEEFRTGRARRGRGPRMANGEYA